MLKIMKTISLAITSDSLSITVPNNSSTFQCKVNFNSETAFIEIKTGEW